MPERSNLVGKRFGNLIVIAFAYAMKSHIYWKCKCDCGKESIVAGSNLRSGHTQSCGCLQREMVSKKNRKNLIGQRFDRLIVIRFSHIGKHRNSYWLCKCDCGKELVVSGNNLKSGTAKSCGCLQKEVAREMGKNKIGENNPMYGKGDERVGKNNPNYKHGFSETKAYKTQYSAKYKAAREDRTPLDADLEKIAYIYQVCEQMNQISEEKYEVDHIKPISKGGLHHQDNLQILEKILNRQKNAKWPLTEIEKIKYKGITLKDLEKNGGNINEALEHEDIVDLNVK